MIDKKHRKNIFSDNPWNDTPYYDMFCEEWVKSGMVDNNKSYQIPYENRFRANCGKFIRHECYKWPERI